MRVSGLELGGLVGSLIAGRLSDALIRNSNGKGGNVGKRVTVRGRALRDRQNAVNAAGARAAGGLALSGRPGRVRFGGNHLKSFIARAAGVVLRATARSRDRLLGLSSLPPFLRYGTLPAQVVMWYTVGIAAALLSFQALPSAVPAAIQWFNVFMIGFFLYGPQVR